MSAEQIEYRGWKIQVGRRWLSARPSLYTVGFRGNAVSFTTLAAAKAHIDERMPKKLGPVTEPFRLKGKRP